jgi:hypothetical protein
VSAWRGQIVDTVVEQVMVPALNQGKPLMLNHVIDAARVLFDKQLAFGRQHGLREPGLPLRRPGMRLPPFMQLNMETVFQKRMLLPLGTT